VIKPIQQRIFEVENARGDTIHCVHDWTSETDPLIVLPPLYEGTVRTNLVPMLYLVNNGFSVLRFDFTHHRGNSAGEMRDFTLGSAYEDLRAVIRFATESGTLGDPSGLGVYATSISSRVVVRYLANDPDRVQVHLSTLGVVDMAKTLTAITGISVRDRLDDPDTVLGPMRIIHYRIDADRFLRDLAKGNWIDAVGTKADVDRMRTPTYLIVAESDKWVDLKDYHDVYGGNPEILRGTYQLPNAGHEIYKNPEAVKTASLRATRCLRQFFFASDDSEPLLEPTLAEIIDQNTHERAREVTYV
jgi:hypothetical protein